MNAYETGKKLAELFYAENKEKDGFTYELFVSIGKEKAEELYKRDRAQYDFKNAWELFAQNSKFRANWFVEIRENETGLQYILGEERTIWAYESEAVAYARQWLADELGLDKRKKLVVVTDIDTEETAYQGDFGMLPHDRTVGLAETAIAYMLRHRLPFGTLFRVIDTHIALSKKPYNQYDVLGYLHDQYGWEEDQFRAHEEWTQHISVGEALSFTLAKH